MKAYKFRIYPTKEQERQMSLHLIISKNIWNEILEKTIKTYEETKKFPKKIELYQMAKKRGLYSQTAQGVVHRLCFALKRKIAMKKKGMKGGFPRFKNIHRMKSLLYPQNNGSFKLGEKLKVTSFGNIKIIQHREIEGEIKTMSLKREPSGKWFAIFIADTPIIPKENFGNKVGIDLGLKTFATMSDGSIIENPRHIKQYENKIATIQRKMSKKVKGSHNRFKQRIKLARAYEKMSNARNDFLQKNSTNLVQKYSLIAFENLSTQEMAQQNCGKFINDAGWSMFISMTQSKAENAGCEVVLVDAHNTTQECSNCGKIIRKELWERTHSCTCGLSMDRDLNASLNILKRTTFGQRGSNACGDGMIVPSKKQEAHIYS
jgi:putative transposase